MSLTDLSASAQITEESGDFDEAPSGRAFALDAVAGAGHHGLGALHSGIHAGAMVRREGDYFGTVVNVASRVAGEAAAGEVLVTPEVVAAWRDNGDIRFDPLGAAALKNVARPVDLFRAKRKRGGDAWLIRSVSA